MNTFSKKFLSIALLAFSVVGMSGFTSLSVANAQSATDLQAQIAALLAQIQMLQAQLGQGGTPATGSYNFTRDLTVGAKGDDVSALQQVLINKGYLKIAAPTGFFGAMTKSALGAWQAASGISPAAGYFGPKTRAAFAATVPNIPNNPNIPNVPAPATGLSVGLASDNPMAGSLITSASASAARVPVLSVNLTAGMAAPVVLNDLNFKKNGVLSDSAISNAYLIENGKVIAQYSSIANGMIKFTGMGMSIGAGQTRKVWLAIDPALNLSAGNTVSFSLASATDVVAVDNSGVAVMASGMFPANGNIFTITSVSNPALASVTITSSTVGSSVYAGDQNVLVSQWTITPANSAVDLKGITFKVIGSANKSDLKNVKLMVNGTQVGPTLAMVPADGMAHFDLTSSPARIGTGSNNLQVYADITGSPSFNFSFQLLNTYDVFAVDTQYNVPVSVTINGGSGTTITIGQGTITVSLSSDTPTGNVAKGGSGTAFAKFKIYAAGEPVKVKWLTFGFNLTNVTTGDLDSEIKNVVLVDDAGNQVGSTINSLETDVTCSNTAFADSETAPRNCFGSSGSPINYIVPANTTRVLTLRGDIQSTATFDTVVALLTGNSSNLQGQLSSQTASSGAVNGGSLTLADNSLTTAQNSAVGTQTYSAGTTGAKIGSYVLTASSAEGVNVNTITVLLGSNGASYQNLKVMIGSTQFGITQSTLSASGSYTFSGLLNVPAGQTKTVDIYADILSSATAATHTTITTLNGCSGSGATTYTSVSCTSRAGQSVVIAGQASLQVSLDSGSQAAGQIVMGSTGNSLATFRFSETSNIEDLKVTDLYVFQQVGSTTTVKAGISNLQLYKGTTLLGTAGAGTAYASGSVQSGYYYKFSFGTPVIVPKSGSVSLALKGDVSSYNSSGATDNTTHVFKITTLTTESTLDATNEVVTALGATSNASTSISFSSPNGNAQTMLRSKLTITATPQGVSSARAKTSVDDLATINFAADAAGSIKLQSLIVTIAGSAPSGTQFFSTSGTPIKLYDAATGTSYNPSTTTASTVSFDLNNYVVSEGTTKSFTLRLNTLSPYTATASNGVAQTLAATIAATTDATFTTAESGGTTGVGLPSAILPIQINSVSFAAGT